MAKVEFIEFNGKKYPVRLGNYSIARFQQETGRNLADAETDISVYEPLLLFALQQGHASLREPLELTLEDMPMVLDDCMIQFIELIPKFFPEQAEEIEKAIKAGKDPGEAKQKVVGGKKK